MFFFLLSFFLCVCFFFYPENYVSSYRSSLLKIVILLFGSWFYEHKSQDYPIIWFFSLWFTLWLFGKIYSNINHENQFVIHSGFSSSSSSWCLTIPGHAFHLLLLFFFHELTTEIHHRVLVLFFIFCLSFVPSAPVFLKPIAYSSSFAVLSVAWFLFPIFFSLLSFDKQTQRERSMSWINDNARSHQRWWGWREMERKKSAKNVFYFGEVLSVGEESRAKKNRASSFTIPIRWHVPFDNSRERKKQQRFFKQLQWLNEWKISAKWWKWKSWYVWRTIAWWRETIMKIVADWKILFSGFLSFSHSSEKWKRKQFPKSFLLFENIFKNLLRIAMNRTLKKSLIMLIKC